MAETPTSIVWFERDLRLADHAALTAAAERGRVLALFVEPPAIGERDWALGAASRWWLHHSLKVLAAGLAERQVTLHILGGEPKQALQQALEACGADAIFCSAPLEPALQARNQALAKHFDDLGVDFVEQCGGLLHDPDSLRTSAGSPFKVFTPFWKHCREQLLSAPPAPLPEPTTLTDAGVEPPNSLPLDELALLPEIAWDEGFHDAWQPGEAGAQQALEAFIDTALGDYADDRDRPDRAGTSRLSPHLHFGEISPGQVIQSALDSGLDAAKYLAEVGWRDFGHHLLLNFPDTATEPMDARFNRFPWRDPDTDPQAAADLRAWQRGETGIELVDAGMRELWHTGWMHNRVRMVVASFLTKNLLIHWSHGARWFWDTLVDADLASNTLGWQWTAGCGADAAPFFRIFNPDLQAQRFDPEGIYRRRWLGTGARPEPIVDLKATRARALEAFAAIKEG